MPLFYCILVKWVSDCYNLLELTDNRLRWYGKAKTSVRLQNSKPLQSHIFGMCGTGIIIQGRIIHGLPPEMPVPDWYQFDTGVDLRIWDVWDYPRKNGILRDLKPSDGLIFIPIFRNRLNLTQHELANTIGVQLRTYQKWEKGDTIPDGYNLIRLMNYLNIDSVQEFVDNNPFIDDDYVAFSARKSYN